MKLGLVANLAIGIPVAILGAVIGAIFFAPVAQTSGIFYVYGSILVVQSYVLGALDPVVALRRTHVLGYAYAIYEILKLVGIYILMVVFHLGIPAALTALFLANLGWIGVYVMALSELWSERLNTSYLRQWINGSFLNTYIVGASILASFEIFTVILVGGPLAQANYSAAVAITAPIGFTAALSIALYPKLLAGGKGSEVESAWKITLLFSLPLTLAVISLSSSLLAILRIEYIPAYIVVMVLAVRSFIGSFNPIFDAVVNGTERMDEKGTITFKQSIHSRLFFSPSVIYVVYAIYLPILWIELQNYAADPLMVALATALLGLPATLTLTTGKFLIARRCIPFSFPYGSAAKYAVIAASLSLSIPILYIFNLVTLPFPTYVTVGFFLLGAGVYFFVLYFIDSEARSLTKAILAWTKLNFSSIVSRLRPTQ